MFLLRHPLMDSIFNITAMDENLFSMSNTARMNSKCQLVKLGFQRLDLLDLFITKRLVNLSLFRFECAKKNLRILLFFLQFSNISFEHFFCADNFRFRLILMPLKICCFSFFYSLFKPAELIRDSRYIPSETSEMRKKRIDGSGNNHVGF